METEPNYTCIYTHDRYVISSRSLGVKRKSLMRWRTSVRVGREGEGEEGGWGKGGKGEGESALPLTNK